MRNLTRSFALLLLVPACSGDDGGTTDGSTSSSSDSETSSTSSSGTTTTTDSGSGSSGATDSGSATDSGGSGGSTSGASATTGEPSPCDDATDRPACEALNDNARSPLCAWIDAVPVDDACSFGNTVSECVPVVAGASCDGANTCAGGGGDDLWWRDGANGKELVQQNFCDYAPVGFTRCEWDANVGKNMVDPMICACPC